MPSSHTTSFHELLPLVPTLTLHVLLLSIPFPSLPDSASSPTQPYTPEERSPGKQMFFSSSYHRQSSVTHGGLHVGRASSSCEAEPVWAHFSCLWLQATQKLSRRICPEEMSVHQLSTRGKILIWGHVWDRKHSPLWLEGRTSLRKDLTLSKSLIILISYLLTKIAYP